MVEAEGSSPFYCSQALVTKIGLESGSYPLACRFDSYRVYFASVTKIGLEGGFYPLACGFDSYRAYFAAVVLMATHALGTGGTRVRFSAAAYAGRTGYGGPL